MKMHSNIFGWEYVWRDFADSKGGEVISDSSKESNPILAMHVPVEGTNTHVTFVPHSVKGKSKGTGTSASIHYPPREHFVFAIRTEKSVDQIGKAFGLQDIQLGDQDFDHRYLIQGSDVGKVRNVFSDMKLRDLIMLNALTELRLMAEPGEGTDEHRVPPGKHGVLYSHDQVLEKFEQLEAVFAILTSVVHKLGAIPALAGDQVDEAPEHEEVQSSNKLHSPLLDMA